MRTVIFALCVAACGQPTPERCVRRWPAEDSTADAQSRTLLAQACEGVAACDPEALISLEAAHCVVDYPPPAADAEFGAAVGDERVYYVLAATCDATGADAPVASMALVDALTAEVHEVTGYVEGTDELGPLPLDEFLRTHACR